MARRTQRKAGKHPMARRPARRMRSHLPGTDFPACVQAALARGEPDGIADELLQQVFTAAVRLYAAKAERRGGALKPFPEGAITATETVVAACAMIRAADLNIFDVAMWFHRPAR
jgi:hypothetical protein